MIQRLERQVMALLTCGAGFLVGTLVTGGLFYRLLSSSGTQRRVSPGGGGGQRQALGGWTAPPVGEA